MPYLPRVTLSYSMKSINQLARVEAGLLTQSDVARHLGTWPDRVREAVHRGIIPGPTRRVPGGRRLYWPESMLPGMMRLWAVGWAEHRRRKARGRTLASLRRELGEWVVYWDDVGALPRPDLPGRRYSDAAAERIRAMRHLLPRETRGWLSAADLAGHLGVRPSTVTHAVRRGVLPPPTCGFPGAKRLFWAAEQVPELKRLWEARPRSSSLPAGYLSVTDVAAILGRPLVTVQLWQRKGLFPRAMWRVGNRKVFKTTDVPHLRDIHDRIREGR